MLKTFVKQDINGWFTHTIKFFMEDLKRKRKRVKKLTFRGRDLNPGYLNNFPALDLNFHGR